MLFVVFQEKMRTDLIRHLKNHFCRFTKRHQVFKVNNTDSRRSRNNASETERRNSTASPRANGNSPQQVMLIIINNQMLFKVIKLLNQNWFWYTSFRIYIDVHTHCSLRQRFSEKNADYYCNFFRKTTHFISNQSNFYILGKICQKMVILVPRILTELPKLLKVKKIWGFLINSVTNLELKMLPFKKFWSCFDILFAKISRFKSSSFLNATFIGTLIWWTGKKRTAIMFLVSHKF